MIMTVTQVDYSSKAWEVISSVAMEWSSESPPLPPPSSQVRIFDLAEVSIAFIAIPAMLLTLALVYVLVRQCSSQQRAKVANTAAKEEPDTSIIGAGTAAGISLERIASLTESGRASHYNVNGGGIGRPLSAAVLRRDSLRRNLEACIDAD